MAGGAGSSTQMLGWFALAAGTVAVYGAFKGNNPFSLVQNTLNPSVPVREFPAFTAPGFVGDPGSVGGAAPGGSVDTGSRGPNGVRAHVAQAAKEMRAALNFQGTIGGWGLRPNKSEHPLGLAIDVMTTDSSLHGSINSFFIANAGRLRVTYIISFRRIWKVGTNTWAPYTGLSPHTDHVHISFAP